MGAPFTDMFPARAPGNDMEFCPLFSDDDVMHMLDLLTPEERGTPGSEKYCLNPYVQ